MFIHQIMNNNVNNLTPEQISNWKEELIKIEYHNIFYHPSRPDQPYYALKEGKKNKVMKPYLVRSNTEGKYIKYQKNKYTLNFKIPSYETF